MSDLFENLLKFILIFFCGNGYSRYMQDREKYDVYVYYLSFKKYIIFIK